MVTNEISFEVWKSNYIVVYARKGEVNARTLVASFKGADGNNLDLANKSVTFYASKPDKTQIYNSCTVNDVSDTASIVLTSQMVSAAGIVDCEYQIFQGDELLLKVGGLKIVVEDNCDFSEAIESTSECNALIHAINEAEEFSEGIGSLSDLTTTAKTTLVAAINEVNGKTIPITNGGTGGTTVTQARTNLGVMTGVQLYYNASGTHGTIALSDSIENYSKIEIFFLFNEPNCRDSTTVWNNGTSSANVSLTVGYSLTESGEARIRFFNSQVTLSGNALTFGAEKYVTLRPKNTSSSSGTVTVGDNASYGTLAIYKIVGYKY